MARMCSSQGDRTHLQKGNSGGTKHGNLAYGNKNGEGADGSLEIARLGIEHGTNARRGKRGGGDGDRERMVRPQYKPN